MAIVAHKVQGAKEQAIKDLKTKFSSVSDYVFADYRGLTVDQITDLRSKLREKECEFKVVKNNFARIAFQEMEVADVEGYFKGPTAVALVKEDANEVAKILFDFAKDAPALHVKGALIEKEIYDEAKIEAFSKLPGKKQLISMIMSAINGPVQKVAATLQAYVEKMEAGEKS